MHYCSHVGVSAVDIYQSTLVCSSCTFFLMTKAPIGVYIGPEPTKNRTPFRVLSATKPGGNSTYAPMFPRGRSYSVGLVPPPWACCDGLISQTPGLRLWITKWSPSSGRVLKLNVISMSCRTRKRRFTRSGRLRFSVEIMIRSGTYAFF